MHEAPARIRLDVCCNNPDDGLFAWRAEQLQIDTWDGQSIEFMARSEPAPRFAEGVGTIRLCRHNWPILAGKEWYGNWCWNAYWLQPEVAVELLTVVKKARLFHCDCGPSQLYDNWNDDAAPLNRDLWLANLWGRHSIGTIEREGGR